MWRKCHLQPRDERMVTWESILIKTPEIGEGARCQQSSLSQYISVSVAGPPATLTNLPVTSATSWQPGILTLKINFKIYQLLLCPPRPWLILTEEAFDLMWEIICYLIQPERRSRRSKTQRRRAYILVGRVIFLTLPHFLILASSKLHSFKNYAFISWQNHWCAVNNSETDHLILHFVLQLLSLTWTV